MEMSPGMPDSDFGFSAPRSRSPSSASWPFCSRSSSINGKRGRPTSGLPKFVTMNLIPPDLVRQGIFLSFQQTRSLRQLPHHERQLCELAGFQSQVGSRQRLSYPPRPRPQIYGQSRERIPPFVGLHVFECSDPPDHPRGLQESSGKLRPLPHVDGRRDLESGRR